MCHDDGEESTLWETLNGAEGGRKYGRVNPSRRLNLDQVPLPFVVAASDRTYAVKGSSTVAVMQPGNGAFSKRQCTLQLCFRPAGADGNRAKCQPRPALIFRGTGTRLKEEERLAYHKDVDVYWQRNAWADTATSTMWAENTLATFIAAAKQEEAEMGQEWRDDDTFVLLCDNLNSQLTTSFKTAVKKADTFVFNLAPNCTDLIQPVDAGYGRAIKARIAHEQEEYLRHPEHEKEWLNGHYSASARRILITKWVGEAVRWVNDNHNLWRYFQRGGSLMTVDGVDDELITLEGAPKTFVMNLPLAESQKLADTQKQRMAAAAAAVTAEVSGSESESKSATTHSEAESNHEDASATNTNAPPIAAGLAVDEDGRPHQEDLDAPVAEDNEVMQQLLDTDGMGEDVLSECLDDVLATHNLRLKKRPRSLNTRKFVYFMPCDGWQVLTVLEQISTEAAGTLVRTNDEASFLLRNEMHFDRIDVLDDCAKLEERWAVVEDA